MTPRKHDVENLTGAYVLHALDEDEATRFETHLGESEQTRAEVTELSDTAVLLGLAVEPVTPPASLKASIMAQLDSTPQLPREDVAVAPVDARFTGAAQAKAQARWFSRPVTALVAAAAAVVLIVGGGVAVSSISNNMQYQQAQADQLAAINAASDSQRVISEVDGGGSATLVWSAELGSSVLMVDGFEALPADKVYELWYINSDGARPAGTFTVGESGSTWRVLDGTMGAGDAVGVTVEPVGGSESPTTVPIVSIASA